LLGRGLRKILENAYIYVFDVHDSEISVLESQSRASRSVEICGVNRKVIFQSRKRGLKLYFTANILQSIGHWVKTETHVAPSGRIILTWASLTTAPGKGVIMDTSAIYFPVDLSKLKESPSGASHPSVKL
jgi:hypothetical protein